jgi:hypothetical protein
MRSRSLVGAGLVVGLSLALGWILSLATTRVRNWFVMTDELYYERLAISVAQTGSLLPRLHGEVISNVNQLYPVLLSTMYGSGNVPASLEGAHRLNAFLIASAALPVYLLARRIAVPIALSVAAGALAVAVPWVVLSSFLLTEVVAYPACCWALLALVHAVERKSWMWDAVALLAIVLAVLARTQFVLLLAVFIVAVGAEGVLTSGAQRAGAELWRTRRPLAVLYGALLAVVLAAVVSGNGSRLLGSYAVTAEDVRVDLELLQLTFAHFAAMALGLALLPFVVGVGWIVGRIRRSATPAERAFALVGAATFVLLALQVASFTQRFGAGLVKDRYLFYLAPIVLIAVAAAVAARVWPPWWALAVPAAVAALGFVWIPVTRYQKLNVDTPVAMLNDALLDLATSQTWARTLLVLATGVILQALLLARAFVPWRAVGAAAGGVAALALPLETVYAFERLFRVDGTNGLPVTLDQGVVFNWIDRNVGPTGRVAVFKFPVGGPDWWAGQAYWWDVEFWNESAVETHADMSLPRAKPWAAAFHPRTGLAREPRELPYALFYGNDVRFRLAGRQLVYDREAYIIEAERPWRADWLTRGIYPDGWSRPRTPVEIRVYAQPAQRRPLKRFVTLLVKAADRETPVDIRSNLERHRTTVPAGISIDRLLSLCVPPGGSTTIVLETPVVTLVHRDPTKAALTGEVDREAGVHLRSVALADETVPLDRCPP